MFILQGCPSWKWFYPYHYAPFASDFRDIHSLRNSFESGTQPVSTLDGFSDVVGNESNKEVPSGLNADYFKISKDFRQFSA